MDVTITANTLARYVPALRVSDDEFRLRLVLHDFGIVFQNAGTREREFLVSEEPELFEPRWDAFVAAYAEHLCHHTDIPTPAWVFTTERHLPRFWYAGGVSATSGLRRSSRRPRPARSIESGFPNGNSRSPDGAADRG